MVAPSFPIHCLIRFSVIHADSQVANVSWNITFDVRNPYFGKCFFFL